MITSTEQVLKRARALGARLRKRLARNHFVAVRGQVHERSDNHRHLLHVRFLDALVHVHHGVVCARVVIQRILDESKARQAHGVEGEMIRAAGIANRQRGHAEISQKE